MLLALAVLVVVRATGLADWRLVGMAFGTGSALFIDAGLIAVSVWPVHHTIPSGSEAPAVPPIALEQQPSL